MKRRLFFGSLIILILALTGAFLYSQTKSSPVSAPAVSPTPQPELKAQLAVLRGSVSLKRDDQDRSLVVDEVEELEAGDLLLVGDEGLVTIDYQQGTLIRLGPGSQLVFEGRQGSTDSLQQILGSIYVRFKKVLGLREEFRLETPTAVATVRGTKFASFAKKSLSKILVIEDTVAVAKSTEPASVQDVVSGDQALIKDDVSVIAIGPAQPEEDELLWLWFNQQADALGDDPQAVATVSAQLFITPTPTPTPKPTATPLPTKPPVPAIISLPGEGYSRSLVKTEAGDFTLTCVGANKGSVRVVTDSANETECYDNCPVLSLQEYATRNGGLAAMNGMYFCPSDYPQCAGKVNTFDTLFFNSRVSRYINSDQNGASVVPFLGINASGQPVFERESRNWPRDTSIQAGTAGNPLLILGTGSVVGEYSLDDKQRNVKSNRGAFVEDGDKIYLCVVAGANVIDSAKVYQTLGADNAINIDGGGSSALWFNGSYIYGPGRDLPTSIIFVRR